MLPGCQRSISAWNRTNDMLPKSSDVGTVQDAAWTTDNVLAEAQVWVRRLACICFAVMIVAEVITGKVSPSIPLPLLIHPSASHSGPCTRDPTSPPSTSLLFA